jgi:drug/metabolite transporter (DMT)-like permease
VDHLIKVVLLVILLGFLWALVLVIAALVLLRAEIPPVRKASRLLVLADAINFLVRLPQRVFRLFLRP